MPRKLCHVPAKRTPRELFFLYLASLGLLIRLGHVGGVHFLDRPRLQGFQGLHTSATEDSTGTRAPVISPSAASKGPFLVEHGPLSLLSPLSGLPGLELDDPARSECVKNARAGKQVRETSPPAPSRYGHRFARFQGPDFPTQPDRVKDVGPASQHRTTLSFPPPLRLEIPTIRGEAFGFNKLQGPDHGLLERFNHVSPGWQVRTGIPSPPSSEMDLAATQAETHRPSQSHGREPGTLPSVMDASADSAVSTVSSELDKPKVPLTVRKGSPTGTARSLSSPSLASPSPKGVFGARGRDGNQRTAQSFDIGTQQYFAPRVKSHPGSQSTQSELDPLCENSHHESTPCTEVEDSDHTSVEPRAGKLEEEMDDRLYKSFQDPEHSNLPGGKILLESYDDDGSELFLAEWLSEIEKSSKGKEDGYSSSYDQPNSAKGYNSLENFFPSGGQDFLKAFSQSHLNEPTNGPGKAPPNEWGDKGSPHSRHDAPIVPPGKLEAPTGEMMQGYHDDDGHEYKVPELSFAEIMKNIAKNRREMEEPEEFSDREEQPKTPKIPGAGWILEELRARDQPEHPEQPTLTLDNSSKDKTFEFTSLHQDKILKSTLSKFWPNNKPSHKPNVATKIKSGSVSPQAEAFKSHDLPIQDSLKELSSKASPDNRPVIKAKQEGGSKETLADLTSELTKSPATPHVLDTEHSLRAINPEAPTSFKALVEKLDAKAASQSLDCLQKEENVGPAKPLRFSVPQGAEAVMKGFVPNEIDEAFVKKKQTLYLPLLHDPLAAYHAFRAPPTYLQKKKNIYYRNLLAFRERKKRLDATLLRLSKTLRVKAQSWWERIKKALHTAYAWFKGVNEKAAQAGSSPARESPLKAGLRAGS